MMLANTQPQAVMNVLSFESAVPATSEQGTPEEQDSPVRKTSRYKEGSRRTPAYRSWDNMKQRCKNQGFILHPRFETFDGFIQAMGPIPGPGYTVDRIDPNNPEYSPENCRWASKALQTANRTTTRYLTDSNGRRYSVAEWARRSGLSPKTIMSRIKALWTVDDAVALAPHARRKLPASSVTLNSVVAPATRYATLWRQLLRDIYEESFVVLTGREAKMLKDFAMLMAAGGLNPEDVLVAVVTNWSEFTALTRRRYGAYPNTPEVPLIDFLFKYRQAAGNFCARQSAAEARERQAAVDRQRAIVEASHLANQRQHQLASETKPTAERLITLEDLRDM